MMISSSPNLAQLPTARLRAMRRAGADILTSQRVLKKAGLNLVGEVLRDALNRGETFTELNHYPEDDVFDADSQAQYYYHAHRSEVGEHGHFHCFLRPKGMPDGVAPINIAASEPWPQGDQALSHLVAIAMDGYGSPTALFTTNRWVTDEAWYPADQVCRMLERFVIDHAFPSWPLNRWISAMLVLYRPHIESLLRQRDATVQSWAQEHPGQDVFEDRALDVTSQMPLSIDDTLAQVEQALRSKSSLL